MRARPQRPAARPLGGRRLALYTLAAVGTVLAIATAAAAQDARESGSAVAEAERQRTAPDVEVSGEDGTYAVSARFTVPQASDVALAVLSDYEQIPKFIPDVRRSEVMQRTPHLLVLQEAVSRFGPFSRTIHLLLEVTREGDGIAFVDRSGKSFTDYRGRWRLQPQGGGTAITYELTARPAFSVPGFMLRRLMSRDSRVMIERLSQAIAARTAG